MNPPEPIPVETVSPSATPQPKINWLVFFVFLLAPAVLALIGASAKIEGLATAAPLVGGGIAGIVCGVQLARRMGKTTGSRVLLGFVFFGVFGALSFALGFTGCMLGGFNLDLR